MRLQNIASDVFQVNNIIPTLICQRLQPNPNVHSRRGRQAEQFSFLLHKLEHPVNRFEHDGSTLLIK